MNKKITAIIFVALVAVALVAGCSQEAPRAATDNTAQPMHNATGTSGVVTDDNLDEAFKDLDDLKTL